MNRILIVDDEPAIRRSLKNILSDIYPHFKMDLAEDGVVAVDFFKKNAYNLVLCDIRMPRQDGIKTLEKMNILNPNIPVVMISANNDTETIVAAMQKNAFNYIEKPLDLNRLLSVVKNALENKKLKVENKQLKKEIAKKYEMIGKSSSILNVKKMIAKIAPTHSRVLITGQNGTGKELVAHQIHKQSNRSENLMVEVNCAAIPSELIESELFGHVKGAFTGAHKDKIGKFAAAHESTLFLDEIGDMNLSVQAKVLRMLQENQITPVGAHKSKNVDVRVLAATNKDLKKEIQQGNFREDLYHRLSTILIKVPSLNERKSDIPMLIKYFVEKMQKEGLPKKDFSKEAIDFLMNYDWRGNIRELRNIVERMLILGNATISEENIRKFL